VTIGKGFVRSAAIMTIVLSLIIIGGPVSLASEFRADTVEQLDSVVLEGRIYVKDSVYRFDQTSAGRKYIVLVDQKACSSRVLSIEDGNYIEVACDDKLSIQNDPIQGHKKIVEGSKIEPAGTEMISGYECDKSELWYKNQKVATQWISNRLNFPVRTITHIFRNRLFELRNIKEGPVSDSLFRIPPSYVKVEKFVKKIDKPEWADKIPGAPVLELPIEASFSAGSMFRIKVIANREFYIQTTDEADVPATVAVVPFKNGANIRNADQVLLKTGKTGQINTTSCRETPADADEIVVRVIEGKVKIKVDRIEPGK